MKNRTVADLMRNIELLAGCVAIFDAEGKTWTEIRDQLPAQRVKFPDLFKGDIEQDFVEAFAAAAMMLPNPQPVKKAPDALVQAVKRHAIDHYEQGGWDIVVECWSDARIAIVCAGCKTVKGAIAKVKKANAPVASHRADVQSTVW